MEMSWNGRNDHSRPPYGRGKRHTRSTLATDVVLEGEMHLRRHGTLFFCEIRAERPTITRCKLFILKLHF